MRNLLVFLVMFITIPCIAADIWIDVDTALTEVPVNIMPLSTDGTDIDTTVTYDEAGMILTWNFMTTGGAFSATLVTPTTGGTHDWVETTDTTGMYTLEIPASGGTINNDTEGFGWFTGNCTQTLPWRGPTIGFRKASMNNYMIDSGTLQDALVETWETDRATNYDQSLNMFVVDANKVAGGAPITDTRFDNIDANVAVANASIDRVDSNTAMIPGLDANTTLILADTGTDGVLISSTGITTIWAKAMVDLGAGAPAYNASALVALNTIYEMMRNQTWITATEIGVYKDNGSTILMESTISDDATTFKRGEYRAEN